MQVIVLSVCASFGVCCFYGIVVRLACLVVVVLNLERKLVGQRARRFYGRTKREHKHHNGCNVGNLFFEQIQTTLLWPSPWRKILQLNCWFL